MQRLLPIIAAGILVLVSGLVQGMWTQRWSQSPALEIAAARLDEVPWTIGPWKGEEVEIEKGAVAQAGLTRAWMRRYTRSEPGASLTVLLMCGRPGPTSVHTPEWCYGGAGFQLTAGPVRTTAPLERAAPADAFWTARFTKQTKAPTAPLRIFWAWNATGSWQAPDYPRLTFGGYPALYKLYIVCKDAPGSERSKDDLRDEFPTQFLPELTRALFPD